MVKKVSVRRVVPLGADWSGASEVTREMVSLVVMATGLASLINRSMNVKVVYRV